MNKYFLLLSIILISSCATQVKEVRKGYAPNQYVQIEKKIIGKNATEIKKLLGEPALEGKCKSCTKNGLYRMIYPVKDMQKFYLEITYNTDVELDCTVIDLYPVTKNKVTHFYFPKKGKVKKLLRCNQKDGVILKLQEELDSAE